MNFFITLYVCLHRKSKALMSMSLKAMCNNSKPVIYEFLMYFIAATTVSPDKLQPCVHVCTV